MSDAWTELGRPGPESAVVGGHTIRRGSRVRLRPRAGGDIFDIALRDKLAFVESLDEDDQGAVHVSVTLEDDPGRDLGAAHVLGHRFFFRLDEVEPVPGAEAPAQATPHLLVAGIGNIFLGDDAFGCEVARRLAEHELPNGVDVHDFGIRGMDLAYALQEGYETVVFVDAAPRGQAPGTVTLIEPEIDPDDVVIDTHGMDPVRVLGLARALGRVPPRVLVVACEPQVIVTGEHDADLVGELSAPVAAAVPAAVELLCSLVEDLSEGKAVLR
jgi:hydrogenase maturation protease